MAGLVSGWSTTGVPVGRSGATTPHAGGITTILYVTVFNGLVNVDQLVQTNSCAEAGDSGGPDWSGHSALGIAAMTDGRGCAPLDPVMYYYSKVNVALARYGGWIITA